MENPQVGNVVGRNGSVEVIEKIVGDLVHTRDIDGKYGASFHIKPSTRRSVCWTCYNETDYGRHKDDCKFCNGTGEYTQKIPGIEKIKLLGETVNEYKLSELIKQKAKIEKEIIKIQKRVSATTRKPRK